jgi:hypothetical protein
MQRWSEYYEEHFELKEKNINSTGEEKRECIQTTQPYIEPPSYIEIEITIDKLKKIRHQVMIKYQQS